MVLRISVIEKGGGSLPSANKNEGEREFKK